MEIRDRGKIKWRPASFMPLGFEMTRAMFKDQERQPRPLIDEYEKEDFDQRIAYAMECGLPLKLLVWSDGFTAEMTGRIYLTITLKYHTTSILTEGEIEVSYSIETSSFFYSGKKISYKGKYLCDGSQIKSGRMSYLYLR